MAYALRPDSKAVAAAALGWGVLNLVIGGIVSVLPLSILPFVPEQSAAHYGAHVVYTLGQIPLVVLGYRACGLPPSLRNHRRAGAHAVTVPARMPSGWAPSDQDTGRRVGRTRSGLWRRRLSRRP